MPPRLVGDLMASTGTRHRIVRQVDRCHARSRFCSSPVRSVASVHALHLYPPDRPLLPRCRGPRKREGKKRAACRTRPRSNRSPGPSKIDQRFVVCRQCRFLWRGEARRTPSPQQPSSSEQAGAAVLISAGASAMLSTVHCALPPPIQHTFTRAPRYSRETSSTPRRTVTVDK